MNLLFTVNLEVPGHKIRDAFMHAMHLMQDAERAELLTNTNNVGTLHNFIVNRFFTYGVNLHPSWSLKSWVFLEGSTRKASIHFWLKEVTEHIECVLSSSTYSSL